MSVTKVKPLFFRNFQIQSFRACVLNGLWALPLSHPSAVHVKHQHNHSHSGYLGLCDLNNLKCKFDCSKVVFSKHHIHMHNPSFYHNFQFQSRRHLFSSKSSKTTKISRNPHVNDNDRFRSNHDRKCLFDRFIYVKTLENFYKDIPSGIVMDTSYADSKPNENMNSSCPVLLGLHDTPGSHSDLVPLMEFFGKLGCRVVCPTFPGHGQTQGVMAGHDDIFCQSTLERAQFVNDFLANLDIERVDVVVGVGASCYTATTLCVLKPETFKSTALISPWPVSNFRFPVNLSRLKQILTAWDEQILRPALRLLLAGFKIGNVSTVQDKITLARLLHNLDFGEVYSQAWSLSMKKIPYIVAYGGQDSEIDAALYDEIIENLDIKSDAVTKYDGVLGKNISVPGVLIFPDSDYDILTQQRGILAAYVLKLLQTLHPHIKI